MNFFNERKFVETVNSGSRKVLINNWKNNSEKVNKQMFKKIILNSVDS